MDLGPPKQRALLVVLLLHAGEIVSTDRLIELIWGEDPPRTAAHSVQIYVSGLRTAFEPDGDGLPIVTRPPGYAFAADPESIDAVRFQRLVADGSGALRSDLEHGAAMLREALELWRGAPLADFAYAEFAREPIRQLEELRLDALEALAAAELTRGGRRRPWHSSRGRSARILCANDSASCRCWRCIARDAIPMRCAPTELRHQAERGVKLIVAGGGPEQEEALDAVAAQHPQTRFITFDQDGRRHNVTYITYAAAGIDGPSARCSTNAAHPSPGGPMTSHHSHRLASRPLALAFAVLALAPAPAFAQSAPDAAAPKLTYRERQALASHGLSAPEPPVDIRRTASSTQSSDGGFDWGSGAIGAGGAAGLIALVTLGAPALGARRSVRTVR